nr:hypothetical protein TDPV-204 [Oriental turtle dovepox virus]
MLINDKIHFVCASFKQYIQVTKVQIGCCKDIYKINKHVVNSNIL